MVKINEFTYNSTEMRAISYWQYGKNWPVVYIIHNDNEAYVGETLDAVRRTSQHLQEKDLDSLQKIVFITDNRYNKSVILDLESFLIRYMSADGSFKLQNGNAGITDHDYFDKKDYEEDFKIIWQELISKGLVKKSIAEIENSDYFKYSPYKALTREQQDALYDIVKRLGRKNRDEKDSLILVKGGAGTGKTVLAIYLMKFLQEFADRSEAGDAIDTDEIENVDSIRDFIRKIGRIKAALVLPMQSLRRSVQNVFDSIEGLSSDMVISPAEVTKDHYDLLIVDEAHRLRQRKSLSRYPSFDETNRSLGLGNDGTELDWIFASSKRQLIFYDSMQTVRPSDIDIFSKKISEHMKENDFITLRSQLRCLGGNDYIEYVKNVLYCREKKLKHFDDYDLRFFENMGQMESDIRKRNDEFGLSRLVAGYGWEWVTKKKPEDPKYRSYDIDIEGRKYIWNREPVDWINSSTSIDEVGCIHTVQGYDLNYAGVIFGTEITYDKVKGRIEIVKGNYHDHTGKQGTSDDELRNYIINIYLTLMTRGIKGTYIYVCDECLREYMRSFFEE